MPKYSHNSITLTQTCALFNCNKRKSQQKKINVGKTYLHIIEHSTYQEIIFLTKNSTTPNVVETQEVKMVSDQTAILTGSRLRILL